MNNLRALLEARFTDAFEAAGAADCSPAIALPKKASFGDYQANGAMSAARRIGCAPRELAERVIAAAQVDDIVARLEVAGPGFINIHLREDWLASCLDDTLTARRNNPQPNIVVVDYSSPNLAKEMHVGHLRSTIIGDAVVRVLEHLGERVVRQNHVGDWGTQFGMLLAHLADAGDVHHELADIEGFYREAKQRFDADPAFAERARQTVVALQGGDPDCLALWQQFIDISLDHCQALYDRLGVSLTRADVRGESAYNDDLANVIHDLDQQGLLVESDGARCVFLDEFRGKDGAPLPIIVQKSDGGYLYATTDLAAMRYRCGQLGADRILYFVDARQALHLEQLFALSRRAGYAPEDTRLEHLAFGTMLGSDGRPFRTRDGGVVKLDALLDEAERRALALVSEKNPDLPAQERAEIARVVGIGAVKYADLSKNRTGDYVFDWDEMLRFDGNTAPYLQYAVTRITSLLRRAAESKSGDTLDGPIRLATAHERTLALRLNQFGETLESVARECCPHYLCAYLYSVAEAYMAFYEQCPVLSLQDNDLQRSRLLLSARTADVLRTGLGLLGIGTVERM